MKKTKAGYRKDALKEQGRRGEGDKTRESIGSKREEVRTRNADKTDGHVALYGCKGF
jgi:hypothetical protein